MTSSSEELVIRGERAGDATLLSTPDLRSGSWTRFGSPGILGDVVVERSLGELAETTRTAAHAQGYAVGWAQGVREARAQAQREGELRDAAVGHQQARRQAEHAAAISALHEAAEELRVATEAACRRIEAQAAELAWAVTREVVGHAAAATTPEEVVRRALDVVPDGALVSVRLHPDVADSTAGDTLPAHVRILADATLGPADVVVEADGPPAGAEGRPRPRARAGGAPMSAGLLGRAVSAARPVRLGRVDEVLGLQLRVTGLDAAVGDLVRVEGTSPVLAEVVASGARGLVCLPLSSTGGLRTGTPVRDAGGPLRIRVGGELRGRVLDGLGRPIDGGPSLDHLASVSVEHPAPHALDRPRIEEQLGLGVRALDALTPCGRGQRLGIMAGSGVGKSSLLSMIARGTDAEISVIALVGERGREVREFIENDLGPQGLARSVVVVATSDAPPVERLRAAFVATRIAEHFRDAGRHVVLMMDSLTRVAMAQREIGLSAGEPPATRGYPPSVFSPAAPSARARRHRPHRQHHRPLHGARRG